jgi:hypothetical protein
MPINITLLLEKTEGAIRNGQFRDTDNTRHTRDRTYTDRHYTTQKKKLQYKENQTTTKGNNQKKQIKQDLGIQ